MKSLRGRLLATLLALIFMVWGGWVASQAWQMSGQQTGMWDRSLEGIAAEILLSMPANLREASPRRAFDLPPDSTFKVDKLTFQVWVKDGPRKAIASPLAPEEPLKPDFRDGFGFVQTANDSWRVYAISDARGEIQVQVGKSRSSLAGELRSWVHLTFATAAGSFLLLATAVWLIIRWSLKPVQAVQSAIHNRRPLDLEPLPDKGLPTEFRPLVDSFNGLLTQLDTALQTERRFISDAAHELRTPLAALAAHAELALNAAKGDAERTALQKLLDGVRRSARLSEQLLDLARLDAQKPAGTASRIDLHELVAVVVRDYEGAAGRNSQTLSLEADACEITGDVDDLGVLVRNLVDNALRYAGAGARIAIACRDRYVRVADNGPGVEPDDRNRIFDRFYRIPGNGGRGSGIGLSLVARIAQMHGASIDVSDGLEGRGLAVTVRFPAPA